MEVLVGPVGAVSEDEAPSAQELQDVVSGLQDLALEGLAAADEVPNPLPGFAGNPEPDQQSGPVLHRELDGVEAVMLPVVAGPGEDECRSACSSFGSCLTMVGFSASSGRTAIMTVSLWISIPT